MSELYLGEMDEVLQKEFNKHFHSEKAAVYNFLNPSDVHPDIEKLLNTDVMINDFSVYDEEYEITGYYPQDVFSMCCNATAWAILQMKKNNSEMLNDVKVIDGNFGWMEHTWLVYKDKYYIDLTLAQFKKDAPKIAILEVNDDVKTEERQDIFSTNPKYREWGREDVEEWTKHL